MYYITITQKYFDICSQCYLRCTNLICILEMIKTPHKLNTLSESQIEQSCLI